MRRPASARSPPASRSTAYSRAATAAERLVRGVRDGRTAVIEGAGHYTCRERPEVFDEILLGFLRTL
ncbi:alpha/beta fold hydrolase [Streptomyces sp. P9-A2]|uniref:alpha/beta fold hydrolase n=1 Tax=Streptomyces sp. P9-A2 TaxID=3072284 RepID=UPI002FC64F3A